jgi:hypothetical protein
MTPIVLVSGHVSRCPERRQSSGKPFTALTLRVQAAGKTSERWRVFAFSESAQAELAGLAVKTAVGRLSDAQREIFDSLTTLGIPCAIVRGIDDTRRAFAAWGIETREARHA